MTSQAPLGSVLRDRGAAAFAPADVARAVLLADDGLYDAVVAVHGTDALHRAGAWRLLRHTAWTGEAGAAAMALRALLGTVHHPLVRVATAALSEGVALARRAAPAPVGLPVERTDGRSLDVGRPAA